jgi:hypothetical protein
MKSKDLFKLAVRLLGLAFLYHGLSGLPAVLPLIFSGNIIMSILVVAWPLLVAYWLLRGAPLLIRIAYPETDGHSKSEQEDVGGIGKQKVA